MLYIEHYTYVNKMRGHHPLERFIFGFLSMLIGLANSHIPVHVLIFAVMLLLLVKKAGIPFRIIVKLLAVPFSFALFGVLAVIINIGYTDTNMLAGIRLNDYLIGITQKDLQTGAIILGKTLSCTSCLFFIALTIPLTDLLFVLKIFRIPALILELMLLIYRFIFVFIEMAINIYTSQSSRCGHGSFRKSIVSYGVLFANLWGKGYLRGQALFTCLLSRGYEDELKVLYPDYHFSKSNMVLYSFLTLLFMAAGGTL